MTNGIRPRRNIWRWLRRIGAGLAILLVVLTAAGAIYQGVAGANDRAMFRAPGRMVDVGGYRLHILCRGHGSPAVILESGLGTTSPMWTRVQDDVAAHTRVCAYDRAGIGWSEPSPDPRDAAHIARELHVLLAKAGVAGPYVLAGHSSGGLYVRAFQRFYPAEVKGMVLLDPTPEDFASTNEQTRADRRTTLFIYAVAPTLASLGVARVAGICDLPPDFPAHPAAQFRALCTSAPSWTVQRDELHFIPDPLPGEGRLLSIPLVVLTSGQNVRQLPAWGTLHDRIAALSSNSLHRVVSGAAHISFLVDARDAHLSATMIMEVVKAAATHTKLH